LKQAVEGISDLITMPGIINVDFADIRSVMENAGSALMGVGLSTGEKRAEEVGWVNGGFFVLEPSVIDLVSGDETIWEREPLEKLARTGELASFNHAGFWQPMDTLREKRVLESLAADGSPPWLKH
jgi:NDP-sugar pyrophosphorylase family protein